ncbi:GNAT family N-acetyltransferase [Streptomyces sp. LX-29]|uniref:GNAT family N-acetyltransferase n=1 Tax=Streptomyces sp. LX-29 TaxID=2900152 RepID=UPI00240E5D4E|nr:GNAT family N-acetyltransferase [Streptomyces sp. LX-29]WFB06594.1 GNAT family N-acetyltransferase [Streptomyces sp. LX-29]
MTTTLRPSAPERRTDDGGRARAYEVCVNSRPVGRIELATSARFGPTVGRIERLEIDERDRHRGRGTVAALAAEEVLRGWGCRRVETTLPATATTALGLAGALGYGERGRQMVKELPQVAPALPAGGEPRAMTADDYAEWLPRERAHRVRCLVERGVPEERARAATDADHAAKLPEGPAGENVALRVLAHHGIDVGTLWVAFGGGLEDGVDAYVLTVEVDARHRRHGHGRALMLLAERESLAVGARTLGLHVFAGNAPALRLYESLDYRPTRYHLAKELL